MKLQIDNFDGNGPVDYTASVDISNPCQITRKLNQGAELKVSIINSNLVLPQAGARIILTLQNNQILFTGYCSTAPELQYLGQSTLGSVYRYDLTAKSDETLLDEKRFPACAPFVNRTAGSALKQLTQDITPGSFDLSAVQAVDSVIAYGSDPQRPWSQQAADIATQARANFQLTNGALSLAPIGVAVHTLHETDANFSPQSLTLKPDDALINDVTIIGDVEPEAYVSDYFIGDGLTLKFYLSQKPFTKVSTTVFDEEYTTSPLDPTRWTIVDPSSAISVTSGSLRIAGGTGVDGATLVSFVEQIEMAGALVMQHGDFIFNAASTGVLGGLYPAAITSGGCLAGFKISPNGSQCNIQALLNGSLTGPVVATIAGHHYLLTTRLYSQEIYRRQQIFHSSLHPAGSGYGGAAISADVRIVVEIQDIDPGNPASQLAPATVLYDGIMANAPGFCAYALVNSTNMRCSIAFTQLIDAIDTEVRSALPGESYQTLLAGTLSEGAECRTTSTELEFFSAYVPAANQQIIVRYRGAGRALARITDPASITAQQRGIDNGIHGAVRHMKFPAARTSADCENAALAILDDSVSPAWTGEYDTWSDFLPGSASDIFPGDAINLNLPSRNLALLATIREVQVTVEDLQGEHSTYKIMFANDAAKPHALEFEAAKIVSAFVVNTYANSQVGAIYLADLTAAQITQATSTTITLDAGASPPTGGGFEVRWSDASWGPGSDRNLIGRFATQTFTVPRLARVQNFFLRQYDNSTPPKYSRFSAALHLDYPLGSTL